MSNRPWFAFVESNTTGSGREFCIAARNRGMRPVVLTTDPTRYPYLRDDSIDIELCETGAVAPVLATCRRLAAQRLCGVTTSSDYYVVTAARVAAALGLPGPDPAALARCRNKDEQRAALRAANVPVPGFRLAQTVVEAERAAAQLGLPVVLKPTAGSGSTGVKLCQTSFQVREWAERLLAVTVNERGMPMSARILVEEFADGSEFSVEIFDGGPVAVVGKHLGGAPYFVEIGHDVPVRVSPAQAEELVTVARAAVCALGVGWGASHSELRWTAGGPVVIEVNPRLAGGMIPRLVALTTGIELVDWAVARSAGQALSEPAPADGAAAIRFLLSPTAGTLAEVSGMELARARPGIQLVQVTAEPGHRMEVTHSFRDRLGYVIATGADSESAASRADAALSEIRLRMR